jgi:hypothetical protein
VVAKGIPRQVRDQAVILMPIVSIVREDNVGIELVLEFLELFLDFMAQKRQEAIAIILDFYVAFTSLLEKGGSASSGFLSPHLIRAEDDPLDTHAIMPLEKLEQGSAAADLDVITMRPQTKNPERGISRPL